MASSFFPNARYPKINGGQFSINHHHHHSSINIDLLRKHCAMGALLDSSERFDPPRCAAETREALIEEILIWIYGGEKSASMAWLFGGAGAGKSALAQTIAEVLQREGRLAGSFFFSRTSTAERSDGNRLIPTLVLQLLEAYPDLKPYIEECISKHPGLFDRAPRTQMDLLFIKPLINLKQALQNQALSTPSNTPISTPSRASTTKKFKSHRRGLLNKILWKNTTESETFKLAEHPSSQPNVTANSTELVNLLRPRLIVIDGLDECNGQEIQAALLQILASAIPRLPIPLRFFIASRPEGNITRTFDHYDAFKSIDIRRISLGDDENAASDIQQFLIRGFQEIHRTHPLRSLLSPSWPFHKAIDTLVQKSSSHFIYASTAMKYIQYSRGRPDSRLEVILGLSVPPTTDQPFAQLDALYTYIFMSVEEPDRTTVNCVFGIVYLAGQSRRSYIETSPIKLEGYLGMQAGEINILLEPLFSLVVLSDDRGVDIKVLHASLFDFLLDESRSGVLHLDLEMAHGIMAQYWFKDMLSYTFDTPLLNNLEPMHSCWSFLNHCHQGHLPDNIKEYLATFPLLYDFILHPKVLAEYRWESEDESMHEGMCGMILRLLHIFFTLLAEKDFDSRDHWHTVHAVQIEHRLRSLQGGLGLGDSDILDDAADHEPLFNDIFHQNLHHVYKAYFNVYPALNGMNILSKILIDPEMWIVEEDLRIHCLIISMPHLTYEDLRFFTRYILLEMKGYSPNGDKELHRVLQQTIVEYLQRVEQDADPSELSECRQIWDKRFTLL